MMTSKCREVIEMLAEGEELGVEQASHLEKCDTCARTVRTRELIAAASQRRNAINARPGFTNRVTAGALQRAARKRRTGGFVLASATAAAGLITAAFFLLLHPEPMVDDWRPPAIAAATTDEPLASQKAVDTAGVPELLDLADVDGSMAVQADWEWIEGPLASAQLLGGYDVTDEE